jgi:phosphate-selective porin OprO/OprP
MRFAASRRRRPLRAAAACFVVITWSSLAPAQAPVPPPPPPNPGPPTPPPPPTAPETSPDKVAEKLRKMEETLEKLSRQNESLSEENRKLSEKYSDLERRLDGAAREPAPGNDTDWPRPSEGRDAAGAGFPSAAGGGSKSGGGDPTVTGRAQEVGNPHLGNLPIKARYNWDNDGFILSTMDDEFTLGIRAMSQVEARIYQQPNQFPVSSGFYNPRTRVYFEGHFTRPIQYEFSFQNTFDNVGLLDAYLNFNYDPRFQLRIGRYKTPFTYEFYRVHVWHLLAPERSLFANNYEGNRRFGLMGWGTLFDQRIEYAIGTFNTQRNSYQAFDSRQDVMAFVNFKPFYNREEGFLLRDLQFGGSVDAGDQDQPTVPAVLRTNSAPSAAGLESGAVNAATLPFLAFNSGVMERGQRALWELHAAYYYGGLSLLGAWEGGYEGYSVGTNGPSQRIPIGGWFAQTGYILTGETLRDRTLIEPLRPFDLRPGRFGLGALEITARYSLLDLDKRVFTAGLADPNSWTNRTQMTDVGFNWYLNKFVKIYADWEHAMFGSPVVYNTMTGRRQLTSDLFWLRFQVYF